MLNFIFSIYRLNADNVMLQDQSHNSTNPDDEYSASSEISTETSDVSSSLQESGNDDHPSDFKYVDDLIKNKLPLLWQAPSPSRTPNPAPLTPTTSSELLNFGKLSLRDNGSSEGEGHLHPQSDPPGVEGFNDNPQFNEWNYWKLPLPSLQLDIDEINLTASSDKETTEVKDNSCIKSDLCENGNTFIQEVRLTEQDEKLGPIINEPEEREMMLITNLSYIDKPNLQDNDNECWNYENKKVFFNSNIVNPENIDNPEVG